MQAHGQNNEDLIAFNYLVSIGIVDPVVLDIGANDGITFSNSRLFSKRGNIVHLVEPSETALIKLRNEYANDDPSKYFIYPYAIVPPNYPKKPFYESGSLLNKGDVALVSTFLAEEIARWGPTMPYKEIDVNRITFEELYVEKMGEPRIDFLTVDVEGLDLLTLKQIDFKKIKARIVAVENNGKDEPLYWSWMVQFGFRLHHKNGENLIFIR